MTNPIPDFPAVDTDFWADRESLRAIYTTARDRMVAPWATFAVCAAKALAIVPPTVTLPPIVGGRGSLNWFAAIVAPSGGGKGAASAVARTLTGPRCAAVPVRNLGSGEGLIDAYRIPPEEKGEPWGQHQAIHFNADEIDSMAALAGRSGSTLLPFLRSTFFAEPLGASTVRSGGYHLAEHTYRLVLTASVQPGRGGWLLADQDGGTPQRFMFFPGVDPRIHALDIDDFDPPPLALPKATAWQYTKQLQVPREAARFIRSNRAHQMQGWVDAVHGHAVFAREKLAYALAVLDGRAEMNLDDWQLSGIAAQVSDMTRQWVADGARAAADAEAAERGRLQAIAGAERSEEAYRLDTERVRTYANRMVRHLERNQPMTGHALRGIFKSTERRWYQVTLAAATDAGLVAVDVNGQFWHGPDIPAGLTKAPG